MYRHAIFHFTAFVHVVFSDVHDVIEIIDINVLCFVL